MTLRLSIDLQLTLSLSIDMVLESEAGRSVVHDLKLSSVVPAKITSSDDAVRVLTNGDLLMKLHYLKGVYYFSAEVARDLTVGDIKEHMARWLDLYYPVSGRIRRQETDGRLVIKCNDSGVRIVEARGEKTVEEWLEMSARGEVDEMELLYRNVLGPDLGFSPLVFLQFTRFSCGGLSLGLSWSHVLGDAFSASSFINMWGRFMTGHRPPQTLHVAPLPIPDPHIVRSGAVPAVRPVDPTGDYWFTPTNRKMNTSYLRISKKHLDLIMIDNLSEFHLLSAMVWRSLSKIRGSDQTKSVTICTNNEFDAVDYLPVNGMIFSTIEPTFSITEASLSEVASEIAKGKIHQNVVIEEMVERDPQSDFILFGANLTFLNLEGTDVYGLELRGQKPVFANYFIDGVGEEGAVLVIPWRENGKAKGGYGRIVTMILPDHEGDEVARELKKELGFP